MKPLLLLLTLPLPVVQPYVNESYAVQSRVTVLVRCATIRTITINNDKRYDSRNALLDPYHNSFNRSLAIQRLINRYD